MSWVQPTFEDFATPLPKPRGKKKTASKRKLLDKNAFDRLSVPYNPHTSCQLWVDVHRPVGKSELAVHKKKVQEVEDWFRKVFGMSKLRKASCLLLTGPAGCGKTATVLALAKELNAAVKEWVNPVPLTQFSEEYSFEEDDICMIMDNRELYQSQGSAFSDFILRASRYTSLDIVGEESLDKHLILVEDLPNAFTKSPESFANILRKYHQIGQSPLVFIVTDSSDKDFNVQKLFPKKLVEELKIYSIQFNPVAPTALVKALEQLMSYESARQGTNFMTPEKSTLQALAESSSGDLRSAINALQFSCTKESGSLEESLVSSSLNVSKSATRGRKRPRTKQVSQSLAAIGGKDTTLFLFHALGKVLHCKRDATTCIQEKDKLPAHLQIHERMPLQNDPEDFLEQTHTSADSFQLFVHQNYLSFFPSVDDVAPASKYLSDADVLLGNWEDRKTLEDCAASVGVRGVMHSNTGTMKVGWKPLHKPQWFAVQRQMRERLATGKELFIEPWWSTEELHTQIVPFMRHLKGFDITSAQAEYVAEVGSFKKTRSAKLWKEEKLDEHDVGKEDEQDEITLQDSSSQPDKKNVIIELENIENDEEETFEIEEYDDSE